jgi:hypothetical protein
MVQLIDKSAVVAEIKRISCENPMDNSWYVDTEELLNFINTLEVKLEVEEEPVSEDLENYISELSKQFPEVSFAKLSRIAVRTAKWQQEQFEKNRLAACDRQAEEEEEIESDFVMGIIESEHRQPTFDDAIKYGMRLQKERLLAKVVDGEDSLTLDGVITFDYYDGDKAYGCVAHDSFCLEDWGLKDMDKVKILILKKVKSYD